MQAVTDKYFLLQIKFLLQKLESCWFYTSVHYKYPLYILVMAIQDRLYDFFPDRFWYPIKSPLVVPTCKAKLYKHTSIHKERFMGFICT